MNNIFVMQVANGHNNLGSIESHNSFIESLLSFVYFIEFTTSYERHYEVKACVVLENVVHANKIGMVSLKQYFLLQKCILNLIGLNQIIFSNCFDGKHFFCLFKLCQKNLTKSTTAQYQQQLEIFEGNILLTRSCRSSYEYHVIACKFLLLIYSQPSFPKSIWLLILTSIKLISILLLIIRLFNMLLKVISYILFIFWKIVKIHVSKHLIILNIWS